MRLSSSSFIQAAQAEDGRDDEEDDEGPEEIECVSDVDYEEPALMDVDPPAGPAAGGAADP